MSITGLEQTQLFIAAGGLAVIILIVILGCSILSKGRRRGGSGPWQRKGSQLHASCEMSLQIRPSPPVPAADDLRTQAVESGILRKYEYKVHHNQTFYVPVHGATEFRKFENLNS